MERALRKTTLLLILTSCALLLGGTNACQKDYELGAQSTVPTAGPTSDGTDDGVSTRTPTPGPTETEEPVPTDEPLPTEIPEPTAVPTRRATRTPTVPGSVDPVSVQNSAAGTGSSATAHELMGALKELEQQQLDGERKSATAAGSDGNWLGKNFGQKTPAGASIDSDGDGFTDQLEQQLGSNESDPSSVPSAVSSNLLIRLQGVDDDGDGLFNQEEVKLGTNPNQVDSDGDGISDGAEAKSNTNPLDATSAPIDSDGDGLSDEFEMNLGSNPNSADSDGDGLRDDQEVALGVDPMKPDTDRDGILDGKEVSLNSDPLRPERR